MLSKIINKNKDINFDKINIKLLAAIIREKLNNNPVKSKIFSSITNTQMTHIINIFFNSIVDVVAQDKVIKLSKIGRFELKKGLTERQVPNNSKQKGDTKVSLQKVRSPHYIKFIWSDILRQRLNNKIKQDR